MLREILIAVTGFGILQSLFFALCLFRQGQSLANRLLAFLFVAICIRISKTFLVYYLDYKSHIYGIGLIAFVSIFPLLYLYLKAFLQKDFHWRQRYWGHFVLALGLYSTCLYIPYQDEILWDWTYRIILLIEFGYLLAALILIFQQKRSQPVESAKVNWLLHLLICVTGVWLMYFLNGYFRIHAYMAGAASYACLLGLTAFTAFKHLDWFLPQRSVIKWNKQEWRDLQPKLYQAMENERLFLDSNLTLPQLAEHLETTSHRLSQCINQMFEQNFSEWLNGYRIQEAQRLLLETDNKILAIALESGFNSLSVFNPAFKRITGITPTQFRKKHGLSLSKL